jgi:uncharacterized protein
MKGLHMVAWVLVIIGGLNWLLIGAFDWSIESVLGMGVSRIVFILVGLSALYELFTHKKNCRMCGKNEMGQSM